MKKGYQEEPIKFLPAQWYEGQKTDLYESNGYSGACPRIRGGDPHVLYSA